MAFTIKLIGVSGLNFPIIQFYDNGRFFWERFFGRLVYHTRSVLSVLEGLFIRGYAPNIWLFEGTYHQIKPWP